MFVELRQLDAGAGKRQGGTGLGLALTRWLVELQDGEVGVTGAPDRARTFCATLPRRAARPRPELELNSVAGMPREYSW